MRTRDQTVYARYTRTRNDLRRLTRNLRADFERSIVRELKQNPKAFWRYSSSRLKTKSRVEDLITDNGTVASTNLEKAKTLNAYFSSVFVTEDTTALPSPTNAFNGPCLETVQISATNVEQKLRGLRPSSSPGPDGLHPRLLHDTAATLATPLTALFRKSLDSGELPSDWKVGEVTPIFKKGCKRSPDNYRPVSLTAVPCKVLESLI